MFLYDNLKYYTCYDFVFFFNNHQLKYVLDIDNPADELIVPDPSWLLRAWIEQGNGINCELTFEPI